MFLSGQVMEEKKKIRNWIKEHKTELVLFGKTTVGAILVAKNWDSIKELFKDTEKITTSVVKMETVVEKIVAPVMPTEILDNLTGNKMTATELGNKAWCSAQARSYFGGLIFTLATFFASSIK